MKIAIHHSPGSFSGRWIEYCEEKGIEYKLVNAYKSDIVEQIKGCDAFMWHHHHANYKDALFAKQLIYSLEMSGIKCFPDFYTTWHFDDKVGQKYLLESIGAPLVPSYAFYSKAEAEEWVNETDFPKVFKLRGGAGSSNVKLAHTKKEARQLVKRAFGKGFSQYSSIDNIKERWRKYKLGQTDIKDVIKGVVRFVYKPEFAKYHAPEKGYVYFQDFVPDNKYDIRVIVIDGKAFAIKRLVRDNDFRASGSGFILYDKSEIPEECVVIAFELTKKLRAQCLGFDFVFKGDTPMIVEMGYGFGYHGYDDCPGYWTEDLEWHEGPFVPQEWMVQSVIK